eukprot:tig00001021_g6307.t1
MHPLGKTAGAADEEAVSPLENSKDPPAWSAAALAAEHTVASQSRRRPSRIASVQYGLRGPRFNQASLEEKWSEKAIGVICSRSRTLLAVFAIVIVSDVIAEGWKDLRVAIVKAANFALLAVLFALFWNGERRFKRIGAASLVAGIAFLSIFVNTLLQRMLMGFRSASWTYPIMLAALSVVARLPAAYAFWFGWLGLAVFYAFSVGYIEPFRSMILTVPNVCVHVLSFVCGANIEATERRFFALQHALQEEADEVESQKRRSDAVLENVFPRSVAEQLRAGRLADVNRRAPRGRRRHRRRRSRSARRSRAARGARARPRARARGAGVGAGGPPPLVGVTPVFSFRASLRRLAARAARPLVPLLALGRAPRRVTSGDSLLPTARARGAAGPGEGTPRALRSASGRSLRSDGSHRGRRSRSRSRGASEGGDAEAGADAGSVRGLREVDRRTAERTVLLHRVICRLERLCERHGLQKVKTDGWLFMAAAGVPEERPAPEAAAAAARFASDALGMARRRGLRVRAGAHVGPLCAGIIGQKPAYDLWGDTVNTASRICSACEPDQALVSGALADAAALAGPGPGPGAPPPLSELGERELRGRGRVRLFEVTPPPPPPPPPPPEPSGSGFSASLPRRASGRRASDASSYLPPLPGSASSAAGPSPFSGAWPLLPSPASARGFGFGSALPPRLSGPVSRTASAGSVLVAMGLHSPGGHAPAPDSASTPSVSLAGTAFAAARARLSASDLWGPAGSSEDESGSGEEEEEGYGGLGEGGEEPEVRDLLAGRGLPRPSLETEEGEDGGGGYEDAAGGDADAARAGGVAGFWGGTGAPSSEWRPRASPGQGAPRSLGGSPGPGPGPARPSRSRPDPAPVAPPLRPGAGGRLAPSVLHQPRPRPRPLRLLT